MCNHLPFFKISAVAFSISLTMACAGPQTQEQTTEKQNEQPANQVVHQHNAQIATVLAQEDKVIRRVPSQAAVNSTAYLSESLRLPKSNRDLRVIEQTPLQNTEKYQDMDENAVVRASSQPVSTFSIDVDTGSYTNARRMLKQGIKVPKDAIRIEEFINYFDYNYPTPPNIEQPFSINTALMESPWDEQRHLIHIGLQGYQGELESTSKNLVFLIDVSGSMNQANKLPLLKRSLTMLSQQLTSDDKVSIVVYAGASGVVLEPTNGNETLKIQAALDNLQAGGSTNGASGIHLAYQLAQQSFIDGGVNRVILATDGDFNVGMVNHDKLIELIEEKREKGIALTTLGFGAGNYNDYLMEQLADAGNGNYAYIDTINEARKVLVDELNATMQIIAKDVKIQVEFNPNQVAEYRLVGYENRALANEDFNNDKVDAGDIGAGHSVTAIYELALVDSNNKYHEPLRYQAEPNRRDEHSNEIAHIKLRYKQPESNTSQLIEKIVDIDQQQAFTDQASDTQFATAVAGFAQLLKQSKYSAGTSFQWVRDTANVNKGDDDFGYRAEFIQLVRNAEAFNNPATPEQVLGYLSE